MLLAGQTYGCVYQACLMAALIQGRDLLSRQVDSEILRRREDLLGRRTSSDFWVLMEAWDDAVRNDFDVERCRRLGIHAATARQVQPLLRQFLDIARREGLDVTRREIAEAALQRCILTAFNDRLARVVDAASRRYELARGRRATLARESIVRDSPLIVAAEIREIEGRDKNVQTMLSLATVVEERWLEELFGDQISAAPRVYYDADTKRVYAEEQIVFRDLPVTSRRVEPPPADAAARLLAEEVLAGRLPLSEWNESVEQWILRVNLLSRHCPELGLAPIGEAERRLMVEQICHGEFSYKALKDKPVREGVRDWLSPQQQHLVEKHAPERLSLGNGRTPRVIYESAGPHVAMRIQELYGVQATPRIAMGRVPVLVHILAPSRRPVQITQDLAGFWREHYPRIKRELQRKYPKHEWR
jgi:ATP-dependent helicase HrpB